MQYTHCTRFYSAIISVAYTPKNKFMLPGKLKKKDMCELRFKAEMGIFTEIGLLHFPPLCLFIFQLSRLLGPNVTVGTAFHYNKLLSQGYTTKLIKMLYNWENVLSDIQFIFQKHRYHYIDISCQESFCQRRVWNHLVKGGVTAFTWRMSHFGIKTLQM